MQEASRPCFGKLRAMTMAATSPASCLYVYDSNVLFTTIIGQNISIDEP